jgi:osmotically-inducible protein OsmY
MHQEDRTSSTGPSGSRSFSTTTSAIDSTARGAKIAGDEAVTAVDRDVAARVRTALSGDLAQPVGDENIHIRVSNGQVILQGWVKSQEEKNRISTKVAGLEGVQGLDNQLVVDARSGR